MVGGVAGAPFCPMTFRTAWATIATWFYLLSKRSILSVDFERTSVSILDRFVYWLRNYLVWHESRGWHVKTRTN